MLDMVRRVVSLLAIVGVGCGVGLYFWAGALYSEGTRLDPGHAGYVHLEHYWCDLLARVTYTGEVNGGRGWGLGATFALVGALLFFWFSVSSLFKECTRLCWIVRVAGSTAVVAATLIFTPLHDWVVTVAAPLGFVAIVAACVGLGRKGLWGLLLLGVLGVGTAIVDYSLWKVGSWERYQPLIQKLAFVLIFLWVVATAVRVLWEEGRRGEVDEKRA